MEAGPSRPRRHTAAQALSLFETIDSDSGDEIDTDAPSFSGSESEEEIVDQAPAAKRRRAVPTDWSEVTRAETRNNYRFLPQNGSGLLADLPPTSTPLDCFHTLFTMAIVTFLLDAINTYAEHRCALNNPARRQSVFGNWYPVTVSEFYKFLAVIVQMGIDPAASIREYWASEESPSYRRWFHEMFPRPRFEAIYHSMLHCAESAITTTKEKIKPFMNKLLQNFRSSFYPYQNLSLDEMVVGFQGRWIYKMLNPSKPQKYHIKVFGLCDSTTGYVLNLLTYFGEQTSYNPDADQDGGQAVKVLDSLLQPFNKGHHLFADRYYTTMKLITYLSANGFFYTGTVNSNRRCFPLQIRTERLNHREYKWYSTSHEDTDILCVSWRDKKARKPVIVSSTRGTTEMATQRTRRNVMEEPGIIHDYNNNMNGCDRADQQSGYYGEFNRKTIKWWKKLFYFMLELSQTNAHILHSLAHGEKGRLLSFKKDLVRGLTELSVSLKSAEDIARENARQPGRPSPGIFERFVGNRHLVAHSEKDRNCAYCSKKNGKHAHTNFFCQGCSTKPYLHPKVCFAQYHTDTGFTL